VVISSRRRQVLEEARRDLDADDRIALVAGDVSSPTAAAELIDTAVDRFGGVDVLVNSTGIFRITPFLDQTEDQFEEALDSIMRPTFYTSQAAARSMVECGQGGVIVSVRSMWALDAIATTRPARTQPHRPAATP
jgi:NAD(P)-dependent dehydrogenase (short-subunit alcohol dehydrogenase family)